MAAGEADHRESGGEASEPHDEMELDQSGAIDEDKSRAPKFSLSRTASNITDHAGNIISEQEERPPLPPRPPTIDLLASAHATPSSSLRVPKRSTRPQLQSQATTAISRTDIQTQSYPGGSRETYANSTISTPSGKSFRFDSPIGQLRGQHTSEGDDSASLRSYTQTVGGDFESLLGDVVGAGQQSPAWRLLSSQVEQADPFNRLLDDHEEPTADFSREFDELDGLDPEGNNEGMTTTFDQERGTKYHIRRATKSLEV